MTPCVLHRGTKVSERHCSSPFRKYTGSGHDRRLRNVDTSLKIYTWQHIPKKTVIGRDRGSSAQATRFSHRLLATFRKNTNQNSSPNYIHYDLFKYYYSMYVQVSIISANIGYVIYEGVIWF